MPKSGLQVLLELPGTLTLYLMCGVANPPNTQSDCRSAGIAAAAAAAAKGKRTSSGVGDGVGGGGGVQVTVVLRTGVYPVAVGGIVLSAAHSGITIQNYQGEDAVVSGAVPVPAVSHTGCGPWGRGVSHTSGRAVGC